MGILIIMIQFTASCLALGMGLFLGGEAAGAGSTVRRSWAVAVRALKVLGAAALATAGVFGALSSVPL
ncbi:MAG: hypothetical protein HY873_14050 [Chloroflexi bacterium]|nr:hypothetical protein [Chloroflexota bacterium]